MKKREKNVVLLFKVARYNIDEEPSITEVKTARTSEKIPSTGLCIKIYAMTFFMVSC